MYKRQQQLAEIKDYIENIDKETTLLLQNLQWDHKHLLESMTMVSCKYEHNHRIPLDKREAHERHCYLRQQGYNKADILLPDPIDPDANTVVKLGKDDIKEITNRASASNPSFKRVHPGAEPLSVERLQQAYTADERRAIHDAVVAAAPSCHDLADLALVSHGPQQATKEKSRVEILAELRDMKRRRTKYRVAAKTRNYSDVLRDVIKTQMELYAEAKGIFIKTEYGSKTYVNVNSGAEKTNIAEGSSNVVVKRERMSPETETHTRDSRRYRERSESRDKRKHDDNLDKRRYKDFRYDRDKHYSRDRRRYDDDHSKRDKHYKIKEESDTNKDRSKHEDYRKDTSKVSQKSGDDCRNHSRHDQDDSSKNTNEYDVGYREHSKHKRSLKEDLPRSSSKYYDRKRAEHSEGRREQKKQYTIQVEEGKDVEDDYSNERKRRRRY